MDAFRKLMSFLESSGGKNVQHRTIASGPQAGTQAIGEHAIMPNSAQEAANRRIMAGQGDINDQYVKESTSQDVGAMLEGNPDLQERYVNDMMGRLLERTGGDVDLAATGWLYGHNLPKERLEEKLANDPEYQARINKAVGELHLQSDRPTYDIPALQEALGMNKKVSPFSKIKRNIKKTE